MSPNQHVQRLQQMQARKAQRDAMDELSLDATASQHGEQVSQQAVSSGENPDAAQQALPDASSRKPRRQPSGNASGKSQAGNDPAIRVRTFAPLPYDISSRDHRIVMDLALFRLSKRESCANAVIHYQLPDGHVRVTSGMYGMATIWDYDIVLMAISHLTEAMNNIKSGKGEKPAQVFRPNINEILKFCKKGAGGSQNKGIIDALHRLSTTHISVKRTCGVGNNRRTYNLGENLISSFKVISHPQNNKIEFIEIKISDWVYAEVTSGHKLDVLSVHPDYFKISQGVGRFVYRLARRTAGKDTATWGFRTLYERSGSTGTFNEFSRLLRKAISTQCVPEYKLVEEQGQKGPVLRMTYCGSDRKVLASDLQGLCADEPGCAIRDTEQQG